MTDNHRAASARIALEAFRDLYGGPVRTEDAMIGSVGLLLLLSHENVSSDIVSW